MPERDIDYIILAVKTQLPEVAVEQLKVKWPADDDGLWWFSLPGVKKNIQIENSFGNCPFLVETDEQSSYDARIATTRDEAVAMIVDYLKPLRKL